MPTAQSADSKTPKLIPMKKFIPRRTQSSLHFTERPKSWASVAGLKHLIILEANTHFFGCLFLGETSLLTNFYQVLSSRLKGFSRLRHLNRISTLTQWENQRGVGNRLTAVKGLVRTSSALLTSKTPAAWSTEPIL
jgi:hypothetical protein